MSRKNAGLFIAGTDTGVGKTAVSAAVLRWLGGAGRRVGTYKPVATGIAAADTPGGDPFLLWEAAGRPLSPEAVCPQVFAAPDLAAAEQPGRGSTGRRQIAPGWTRCLERLGSDRGGRSWGTVFAAGQLDDWCGSGPRSSAPSGDRGCRPAWGHLPDALLCASGAGRGPADRRLRFFGSLTQL